MTRDDIIRMAREAECSETLGTDAFMFTVEELESFAALVAEACAKVCDDKATHLEMKAQEAIEAGEHDEVSAIRSTAWQLSVCADAIRARGDTNGRG